MKNNEYNVIGNIWMFGGLLLLSKKVERFERKKVL